MTTQPDDAQVCHLLGPLTFKLKWGKRQRLEVWPKPTVFSLNIGTPNLPPQGWPRDGFDFSPLTISEVPTDLHPVARFEFPAAGRDGKPLREELILDQRCCGDTYYSTLTLPKGVTSGAANVTVTFSLWLGSDLQPAFFEVPITQGFSERNEAAYILFHNPQIELKDAVNVLRREKLGVTIRAGELFVQHRGQNGIALD